MTNVNTTENFLWCKKFLFPFITNLKKLAKTVHSLAMSQRRINKSQKRSTNCRDSSRPHQSWVVRDILKGVGWANFHPEPSSRKLPHSTVATMFLPGLHYSGWVLLRKLIYQNSGIQVFWQISRFSGSQELLTSLHLPVLLEALAVTHSPKLSPS